LQFAAASVIAGALGGLLGTMPSADFWALHGAVIAGAGGAILLASRWLMRRLTPAPAGS
jgi:uncharacterized membrane protein